ncbi:hypothetical protein [Microbispora sp. NPDC049125]|uniref:hypothetical protein n=1 Tax=Microbispora sp. NPDC049125 TaxID=3154929 RepID=UPI003465B0FD
MNGDTVRKISFEWALEGKEPGSYDDYELLSWSDGRLGSEVFEEIRSRYATGASPELPQVTIAGAATKEQGRVSRHVVLAIQEWSGHRDGTNRKVAYTRWFFVPYEQLIEHRVSYETLYGAFARLPVTPGPPLTVDVPELDPKAASPGPDAMSAAALLMTGRPVCVVGAEGVEMPQRLRFLDAVAALMPYGLRTRLTASTWASSTAEHKIRLFFARHAPEGAHAVSWGRGVQIPRDEGRARACLDMLTWPGVEPADVIGRLSEQTAPLSFAQADRLTILDLIERACFPSPEQEPEPDLARAPGPAVGRDVGPDTALTVATPRSDVRGADLRGTDVRGTGGGTDVRGTGGGTDVRGTGGGTAEPTVPYQVSSSLKPSAKPPAKPPASFGAAPHADDEEPGPARWKWSTWNRRTQLVMTVVGTVLGIALAGVSTVAVVNAVGQDDAPPAQSTVAPPAQPVVVQASAGGKDRFVAEVVAETLRRAGFEAAVQVIDKMRFPQGPAVTVAYDLDTLEFMTQGRFDGTRPDDFRERLRAELRGWGLSQLASLPSVSRDVLMFDPGQVKADKLESVLKHPSADDVVLVRDSFGEGLADALLRRYPEVKLRRAPAQELPREMGQKAAKVVIAPEDLGVDGYQPSDLLDDVLPERTLIVLVNAAVDPAARQALTTVTAALDQKRLEAAGQAEPQQAARELVDQLVPLNPAQRAASSQPQPAQQAPPQDKQPGVAPQPGDSFPLSLIFIVVAAVIGFLGLVLLLFRFPDRYESKARHGSRR